jgi:hypothetical protein
LGCKKPGVFGLFLFLQSSLRAAFGFGGVLEMARICRLPTEILEEPYFFGNANQSSPLGASAVRGGLLVSTLCPERTNSGNDLLLDAGETVPSPIKWGISMSSMVAMQAQRQLLEVVLTLGASGSLTDPLDGWDKQAD